MDEELQETVESLLGPGVTVVDCEKRSCVREEEVLLVNGVPVPLEGAEGAAIREALLRRAVPHSDLLGRLLLRAGVLRAPVRLDAELSVKSSVVTREEVTVARAGRVVDERSRETKEDSFYTSSTSEVWEPATAAGAAAASGDPPARSDAATSPPPQPQPPPPRGLYFPPTVLRGGAAGLDQSSAESVDTAGSGDSPLRAAVRGLALADGLNATVPLVPGVQATTSAPTIFGTVASDQTPKDGNSRRNSFGG